MNGYFTLKSLKYHSKIISLLLQIRSPFTTHFTETPLRNPLTSLQCGALLQSFTKTRSFKNGVQLHAHMISSGVLFNNTYLNTKLCAFYAIFGSMSEARALFDEIVLKNSFLWNVMIRGYACNGFPVTSLVLYRQMLCFGKRADNFTYPFVLKACGDLLLIETGRKIHCEVVISGLDLDIYVDNSLLAMYLTFGEMETARKLFDKMPKRDLTSWNTMISGYTKNGDPGNALLVFDLMGKVGIRADSATFLSVLPACSDLAGLKQGKEIHGYAVRNSIMEMDSFVENSLIDVYCSCNFIVGARRLFEVMVTRDTVTWNSLILGYARRGDAVESLYLFRRMNSESIVPDQVTIIAVLGACDQMAASRFGRCVHAYLTRKGFMRYVIVGTALIDMYAKCGSLDCSISVFDEMPERNLVSWSAMVSGFGLHGRGREAIAIFSEMKVKGIRPDEVTFISVLSACSHAGLVKDGCEIFNQMSKENSLVPRVEHYSCMVDLLGRAGHLDKAYEFIKNMKVKPSVDVWTALLSACRIHRNIKLAEIAAKNAFEMKPKSVSLFVSLSNIYAAEKRWDDMEMVRATVRRSGLRKPPGCSFVELDNGIHRFLVGDKSHPQSEHIYAKLEDLSRQLKKAGYKPDTSSVFYDVDEDVKERMLWSHSERLAIAFSLLNTFPGSSIKITKNLRVCEDCHTVTKLISSLVSRDIVVRDAHRFHHFRDGSCSCGDYW